MSTDRYAVRRDKLLHRLRKDGVGDLLVTNPTNVRYLTGFSGEDSYLLLGPGATLLISDARFTTQIAEECPGLETHIRPPGKFMHEAVAEVLQQARLATLAFESAHLTHHGWQQIAEAAKPLELVPKAGLVEEFRQTKDAGEVAEIREAIRQAERGAALMRSGLVGEMTELQAAAELEYGMRKFGARKPSFDPIVAVGARAALPHARPGETRISDGDLVLVDWGSTNAGGYRSDLTRVWGTARISSKLEKVHRVVFTAQRRAIAEIRPGVECRDIDAIARKEIERAGYGKQFGHGLGHGIGLDVHEGPRLGPSSKDVLKAGMVVTVEPGVYLPGWGGVRIEDDVLVTRDGCEVLSSIPADLERIPLD
ncbi:MAG: Xaa-Pro peptidase family protein [Planctomycetales bacterium]